MRKIRTTVCVVFAISCIIFGIYIVKSQYMEDHTPPVISCREDTVSVSVNAEESEILDGVTASDDKDGDITKSVRISSMSHFISKGKRTVTYIVFDNANQAATAERTLIYTDYSSPKIHLKKPLRCTVSTMGNTDFTADMTAEDCLDGDLTKQIYITEGEGLYSYEPGTYTLTAQVSNRAGDVRSIPLDVVVASDKDEDEARKSYPMLKEYIAYTTVGVPVDTEDYLKGMMCGNAEYMFEGSAEENGMTREEVEIQSNVDYAVPGVYSVEYRYTNEYGLTAVTKLYVVVEE